MPLDASYDGYRIKYRHSDQSFVMVAPPTPSGPVTLQLSQYKGESVPSGTMVTNSWSPAANDLLVCAIGFRGSSTPSAHITGVSGNGLTWAKAVDKDDTQNALGMQIWWAKGASPSAGAVTLSLSTLTISMGVQLLSFSNVHSSPVGNTASTDTGGADTTTGNVNLTTTAANSKILMFVTNRSQNTSVPGGSIFTSILANQAIDSGGNINKTSSWLSSEITSPGVQNCLFNLNGNGDWIMAVMEIKRA